MCQDRSWEIESKCIEKGRVLDLITSAPDLEYLGLTFKTWPPSMIDPTLNATIGNIYWSSLKAVSLDSLPSDEHELGNLCKRHAHTLKDLSLRHMKQNKGSWDVTVDSMRRAFRLG